MGIDFSEQVVIVTGAARGLGKAYAVDLARRGATVVVNDVPGSVEAEAAAAEIRRAGGKAVALCHSVSTREGGEALVADALDKLGRIDALINNAGILRPGLFDELDPDAIAGTIDVHLFGAFNVSRPAYRAMRAAGYGRIVNVCSASIFGFMGMSAYAAAKGGIFALTHTMAQESAAFGIKVNALFPASNTPMTTQARESQRSSLPGYAADQEWNTAREAMMPRYHPEGVAAMVAVLASRLCPVSGEAFSALAGRYARVFLGIADGWLAPALQMTPEAILAHMDTIRDTTRFMVPTRARDEFLSTARRVAALASEGPESNL